MVVLKSFEFLVNTLAESYLLFLGNVSFAFVK